MSDCSSGPCGPIAADAIRDLHAPRQNISLALGIQAVFFALALAGQATLWMAVFADMGASLPVVANGLRRLRK